ncbi:MAG: thioredoxin family protein [Rhodobacteraceae bacterium]|nr:thioredoxin family protein [Paracoccaceae bacterium]
MARFLAFLAGALVAFGAHASELGDDGLHKADWMRDTFKDLSEDLAEANEEGKRLMLIFEQRGCIYCTKMHQDVFPDPAVTAVLEDKYFVVQLNLHGSTEVTDFDGETLEERHMARKWGILFTPTLLFLPQEVAKGQTAPQAAVAQMPGAFGKGTTLDMLTWVAQEGYLNSKEDFQRYHARMIQERNNGSFD